MTLPETPPDLKTIRSTFREGWSENELTVWVDTRHGFLPRRIEVFERNRHILTTRILNEDIREVAPGVWMPMKGEVTHYYVAEVLFPDGLTKDQVAKLDKDTVRKLLPRSLALTRPLGYGTQTHILDEKSLRVNEPLPRERFVIDYPEGTTILDTTKTPPLRYKVGREPE